MPDPIRIGIIGAGSNTRRQHLPKLQAIPGVELAAVCNRSVASGQAVADAFGIPRVCQRWDQITDDPDLDAVVIGTWPYLHCRASCAALAAGKHVLCEARMAMDADEAREMLDFARARPELVAQVVPSPFTLPYDTFIQDLLAADYVGELLAVNVVHRGGQFVDPEAPLTWRQDFALSGFNTMALGIFYEALARWVGHARLVTAQALVSVKTRLQDGKLCPVRIPDHLNVSAELECGASLAMQFSAVCGLAPANEFLLCGDEGTLHLDLASGCLSGGRRGDDALTPLEIPADVRGGWRVEEEFIGAIRGAEPVRLTAFEEGLRYMEFTEAVYRSWTDGSAVSLPLL